MTDLHDASSAVRPLSDEQLETVAGGLQQASEGIARVMVDIIMAPFRAIFAPFQK